MYVQVRELVWECLRENIFKDLGTSEHPLLGREERQTCAAVEDWSRGYSYKEKSGHV